jgi:hypothetical protein
MDDHEFYLRLFAAFRPHIGPIDKNTIVAIVGFDAGGPLNFCTIGAERAERFVTYISCELAVRREQQPSEFGRYELLISCDSEKWVRSIVTEIGRMSLETVFGHHHTLDIGAWVEPGDLIQGVVFEEVCAAHVDGQNYGILRCVGITRSELEFALQRGSAELLDCLREAGVYPNTSVRRESVV